MKVISLKFIFTNPIRDMNLLIHSKVCICIKMLEKLEILIRTEIRKSVAKAHPQNTSCTHGGDVDLSVSFTCMINTTKRPFWGKTMWDSA